MRSLNYAELYLVAGGEDGGDGCGGDCGSAPSSSSDGSLNAADVAAALGGVVNAEGNASVSIIGHVPANTDALSAAFVAYAGAVGTGAVAGALRGALIGGLAGAGLGALSGAGYAAASLAIPALAVPAYFYGRSTSHIP